MKLLKNSSIVGVVAVAALAMGVPAGAVAHAPVAHTHVVALAAAKPKTVKVAFKGSYTGTMSLLMMGTSGSTATSVTVTKLSGTGTGTDLGKSTVTGTGSAPVSGSSECDPFSGTGSMVGGGSKLLLKVVSSAKQSACATGTSAPTSVNVKGVATVLSGTGKYKGVSGTLAFKGSFIVQNDTVNGTTETDHFSATFTGTLTIKK